jgi:hypothetical protein
MQSTSNNLPALLIISGIDLLLAALCAAIGMLVLLIGSTSTTNRAMSDNVERMSDWSLLIVIPHDSPPPALTCDGRVVTPQAMNGAEGYVVGIRNDREWQCLLKCDGKEVKIFNFAAITVDETSTQDNDDICSSGAIEIKQGGSKPSSLFQLQ